MPLATSAPPRKNALTCADHPFLAVTVKTFGDMPRGWMSISQVGQSPAFDDVCCQRPVRAADCASAVSERMSHVAMAIVREENRAKKLAGNHARVMRPPERRSAAVQPCSPTSKIAQAMKERQPCAGRQPCAC